MKPTVYANGISVVGESLSAVTRTLAHLLLKQPEVQRRGGSVREIPGWCQVEIADPRQRLCLLSGRGLNPWTTLCEFPWLMAGRNDIAWLLPYLPGAANFSDDGVTWRAGYGPRMTNWDRRDQLYNVVAALARNPASRQAVISLWDPNEDDPAHVKSNDFPCTNWMQFMVRDGHLDMAVVMRSNDLIWGFSGVNVTNFTLLQELVAYLLGLKLGRYWHGCFNTHVYEGHYSKLRELTMSYEAAVEPEPIDFGVVGGSSPETRLLEFRRQCRQALKLVQDEREKPGRGDEWRQPVPSPLGPFLSEWCRLMMLHQELSVNLSVERWRQVLLGFHNRDWAIAAAAHAYRTQASIGLLRTVADGLGLTDSPYVDHITGPHGTK